MIKVAGVDHIVLRTTRLEQMLMFYEGVLGCQVERRTSAELGLVQLRAGNALIDLVSVESDLGRAGGGPPTIQDNNMDHYCLQLEPVSTEEIARHLTAHGIDVPPFDERYGAQGPGKSIYIKDPQGNTVELRSRQESH